MKTPPILHTFGCRLNSYESEVMRQNAQAAGVEDIVIINSCAVTAEAERQVAQTIRRARREHPDAKILVTGCAAQRDPERYAAMAEVDYVVGNALKTRDDLFTHLFSPSPSRRGTKGGGSPAGAALSLSTDNDCVAPPCTTLSARGREEYSQKILLADLAAPQEVPPLNSGYEGKPRGFVQIQMGCDHACTFCIVPSTRGPSRSVPLEAIVAQIRALQEKDYHEFALTGVDITAYGADLQGAPTFTQMLRRLLAEVPTLGRLRLSSLDPAALDDEFFALLAHEERLAPHLHLSLQAGDDMILKRMKRRHSVADIRRVCEKARAARPDVTFGADVIAGFPTEDDAMFDNTLRLLEEMGILWLHVFPYSARSGTPAARMPQVKPEIRRARAARLREVGNRAIERYLTALEGQRRVVLVEQPFLGREPGFAEIRLVDDAPVGHLVPILIIGHEEGRAIGCLIPEKNK